MKLKCVNFQSKCNTPVAVAMTERCSNYDKRKEHNMNDIQRALDYIINKTSKIIDMNIFDLVDISRSNSGDAWLAHFVAMGKTAEIEFAAELHNSDNSICYYSYQDDLKPIENLQKFISNELNLSL